MAGQAANAFDQLNGPATVPLEQDQRVTVGHKRPAAAVMPLQADPSAELVLTLEVFDADSQTAALAHTRTGDVLSRRP